MSQTIALPVTEVRGNTSYRTKTVKLIYVNDTQEGISRIKIKEAFIYEDRGKNITDAEELERIRKIVIPPAWKNVWICRSANGHIQATGFDAKNRKQYKYHPLWNQSRNQTKFNRLLTFGEKLPQLRSQLQEDLSRVQLDEEKVIATVVSLMERTYIRIGSNEYEKLYGSYGLTTFKDKHVNINGSSLQFSFTGKKGIHHSISLKNKKLARIVKQCKEIPGKELFQYYNEKNEIHVVDSGHVNEYIKNATGEDFTAKDFRTWAGTLHAFSSFYRCGEPTTNAECKKKISEALDYVSKKLGNTRTVCKKYYVHPLILDLYEKHALHRYLKDFESTQENDKLTGWTGEEKVLLKILKTF